MQKTFASAHILTISYKDEGKLHYFRVTTLLAGYPGLSTATAVRINRIPTLWHALLTMGTDSNY